MVIRLNRGWWDGAWERETLRLDAAIAEQELRERGQAVTVVDGDDDTPGDADTDAEREAVKAYYAEMKDAWNVGVHCGTMLLWEGERAAEAQQPKRSGREMLAKLPPESRAKAVEVLKKLLRAPRSDGSPPLIPPKK